MKKIILTCLASATLFSAPAQLFSPESLSGAFWGSYIGGLAGGDCHHGYSGEGAAIGAGVGLLVGALAGEARRQEYYRPPAYAYAPAPTAAVGYGYTSGGASPYVYYAPNAYSAPGYYYQPARPNYAVGGTLLGAASGALIGEGASGKPGEGAAIGAAAGLVLGTVAELTSRNREKKAAAQMVQANPALEPQAQVQQAALEPTQDSGRATQNSSGQVTSKPCPSSTYYWTSRPQIPDAPRVPDAPRF